MRVCVVMKKTLPKRFFFNRKCAYTLASKAG